MVLLLGLLGNHTVVTQSPPIDITDAVEVVSDLKSFDVDTIIPTSTISEVDYDSDLGVITIRGENFTSIATLADSDVADLLNWNNFVWDIDGDDGATAGHVFSASDFTSVVIQDGNTILATLTANAKDQT